jgi:non-specific serine/threonine protein kinase
MGEAAFTAAWAAGKAMTPEDAVGIAMSEELATKGTSGRYARITSREREIVLLVSRGLTNHQIAEELFISKRTVDSHLRKIFKKLGLDSRTQVAAWATEHQSLASDQN